MVHVSTFTLALAAGVVPQLAQAGLNTAAKASGKKFFGSATDNPNLDDEPYMRKLSNTDDFGQITPGNSMKWGPTEPSQGTFTFDQGDAIVDLAESNGQMLRCHALVWHNQLPDWVSSGSWTNETLIDAMENHILAVTSHYKGKCYAWDVVNEALNEDGTYRESIFYNTIGEAYIPIAFAAAAQGDPDVKLYYNDYNLEWPSDKTRGAQRIVRLIRSYGGKIDGVGLQGHLIVGSTPSLSAMETNLQDFAALDVETSYTELDIRMELPPNDDKLAQQKKDFHAVIESCNGNEKCIGTTIWDYTDKYSWVPGVFDGYGAACPWDENLEKKPAYSGILSALGGSGTSPSESSTGPSPTPTGGVAQHWEQCGGNGWTGPTTCASPYTCTTVNQWYSQCL